MRDNMEKYDFMIVEDRLEKFTMIMFKGTTDM